MKPKMKDLAIATLIILLIISGVGNVIMLLMYSPGHSHPTFEVLKVARTSNPVTMDPCDSWDSVSNDMLDQVMETLIAYNLSDPEFPLVGRLASAWDFQSTPLGTNITFQLRPNVYFHDDTLLTGECVIHTFTRINFFGNWTGTLTAPHHMAAPHSLYKFANGTPIFNETLSFVNLTNPLEVTLVLNGPFAPAEGLLAYTASSIVHPYSTPVNEMLELGEDRAIGTGPFRLVYYVPNSAIWFDRWKRYWDGPAYWDEIVYVYYRDAVTANNAMLRGDIDYLGQGIAALQHYFNMSPYITVTGDGVHDYINGATYNCIVFKSEWINRTWRKAICHAYNYSYLIHNIMEDTVVRANSLVPPGIQGHNSSVVGGTFNITKARQIMQSMGYGYTDNVPWDVGSQVGDVFTPGANETLWKAAEFIPNVGNFSGNVWNFYVKPGSLLLEFLTQRFIEDMDLIGIKVEYYWYWWAEWPIPLWWWKGIHLCWLSKYPNYFEAFNMIDSLVNPDSTLYSETLNILDSIVDPASTLNILKINNTEINTLLATTVAETSTATRYEYYKKLQYLIHDKYYYHMPLFYDKLYYVHAATLKGFPYNCMRNLYWYPTYRD